MIKELLTPIIAMSIGLIGGGIFFLLDYLFTKFTKKKEHNTIEHEESELNMKNLNKQNWV